MLEGRRTKLKFDDFISETIWINNGIGQGDPLSMILYILYNADLLEIASSPEEESLGYVDDVMVMAEAENLDKMVETISDFMNHENGGFDWSDNHNSRFEINKSAVVHFTRKRIISEDKPRRQMPLPHPELVLRGKPIKVLPSYKYLGIHVDNQLRWTTQSRKAIAKATAWILLFRRLTRPASGLSAKHMRQLYLAVVVPKMMYGIDTWYTLPSKEPGKKRNSGSFGILKEFAKLQRIATLAINGALRSSPTDLLYAHSGLLPMGLLLKKICYRAIVRISMLPASNPVSKQLASYYHRPAKIHPTNIQNLLKIFNYNPKVVKKITPHS